MVESLIPRRVYNLGNAQLPPPKEFKFRIGQEVVRKSTNYFKPELQVLGYHENKLWLNDMTMADESEVEAIED